MYEKLTKNLTEGDILAKNVRHNDRLMVRSGTRVNAQLKKRLLQWGIKEVVVQSKSFGFNRYKPL